MPRFRIRAYSAIVRFETEHSARFFLLFSEVRLLFVNYLQNGFSCCEHQLPLRFLEIIFRVTCILSESNNSERRIGRSGVSRKASFYQGNRTKIGQTRQIPDHGLFPPIFRKRDLSPETRVLRRETQLHSTFLER